MRIFIIRVHFDDDVKDHYRSLKLSLEKIGFTKKIRNKQGKEFHLPNGNYLIESSKTANQITSIVKSVAIKLGGCMVLTVESNNISWDFT